MGRHTVACDLLGCVVFVFGCCPVVRGVPCLQEPGELRVGSKRLYCKRCAAQVKLACHYKLFAAVYRLHRLSICTACPVGGASNPRARQSDTGSDYPPTFCSRSCTLLWGRINACKVCGDTLGMWHFGRMAQSVIFSAFSKLFVASG